MKLACRALLFAIALAPWAACADTPEREGAAPSTGREPRVVVRDNALGMPAIATTVSFMIALGATAFFFMGRRRKVEASGAPKANVKKVNPGPKSTTGSFKKSATGSYPKSGTATNSPASKKAAGTYPPKASVKVSPPPDQDLEPLVWESPVPSNGPITLKRPERSDDKPAADPVARRIRERYLAARFPGVLKSAQDLGDTGRIIKCARLLFEDGLAARAGELLDLASEENPEVESAWLANLEIAFLDQDPERYTRLAHAFRNAHPDSPDWPEVARLGRRIAPMHPRFADANAAKEVDQLGPWPQMPNWIQANWDLTGEVAATELRARLVAGARFAKPALSKAA